MYYFKRVLLINFLLIIPLLADPRAPDGQCYIVLPVENEDAAIEELDINPNYLEVYESDDARTTYVTLGKTYIDLFNANKNIFPSNTRCSKGNNLGSYYLWLIEDPGMSKSYLINSYILGEKPIGSYGFDRITIKRFTTKDIEFLFSSNLTELKKLVEPYSTFINQKGIEYRKAEEARLAKENAAIEAKKIALAKAAEEEANKKAAAEAAALKAIADAEEAKQLEKENRRTWWLNLFKWIGIILISFLALGQYSRKREATKAGFESIKAYDQHLKEKREEEERLKKLEEERKHKERLEKLKEQERQKKQRELKKAQDAGFSTVSEHKKHLRKKEQEKKRKQEKKLALDAGFSSVSEYKKYLDVKRRADEAEARARRAEAEAREAKTKANNKDSDGSLLKTAAGVAVAAAAIRAARKPHPPRIVFKDPNIVITEVKYIGGIAREYKVRVKERRRDGSLNDKGTMRIGPRTSGGTKAGGFKVYWDG
tara:strand:- start:163 stop:1614 length:1452 start_codon:yes stop_codon:yes gene_type:complete